MKKILAIILFLTFVLFAGTLMNPKYVQMYEDFIQDTIINIQEGLNIE